MADDLFPEGDDGKGAADDKPAGDAKPTKSSSEQRLVSLEAHVQKVVESQDRLGTGVAQAFDKFAKYLSDGGSANGRRPNTGNAEADEVAAKILTTKILTDPRAVLDEHFMSNAKKVLGPSLNLLVDSQHDSILQGLSEDFDNEHGDGSFDKLIRADYDAALEKLPYESRASRSTLEALVNGIRGSSKKFKEVVTAYNETQQRRTRERESPPALIGGSRSVPSVTRLSDDDRAYLADVARKTGAQSNEKHLLEIRKARDPRAGWSADNFPEEKREEKRA